MALAKEKGKVVSVALCNRYHKGIRRVKELVDAGVLGKIINIRATMCEFFPHSRPDYLNTYYVRYSGCFELIHAVDYAIWVAGGAPTEIYGIYGIRLPEHAIAAYWNAISAAALNTDFIIYNIPQLAGTALSPACLKEMLKNPRVIGVKNSSMPTMDIQTFKAIGGENFVVFNAPDEQLAAGLAMGAVGGTYGVMPELYIKIKECIDAGDVKCACALEFKANEIISRLVSCKGNLYASSRRSLRFAMASTLAASEHLSPRLKKRICPRWKPPCA